MFSEQIERDDILSVFNLFDEDKNGLISASELKKMVHSFGQNPTQKDIDDIVTKFVGIDWSSEMIEKSFEAITELKSEKRFPMGKL